MNLSTSGIVFSGDLFTGINTTYGSFGASASQFFIGNLQPILIMGVVLLILGLLYKRFFTSFK